MIQSILSVIGGFVTCTVLVIVSTLITAPLMLGGMDRPPTTGYLIVNVLYGAASAFAGGYVTGWIAKQRIIEPTVALSVVLLLMGLPGIFSPMPGQPAWYPSVIVAVGVLFSLAGGYARSRQASLA